MDSSVKIESLYRAESAKILASLTRIFGVENLDLAEDCLQETFSRAIISWNTHGLPEKPGAWLMFTAKNCAIDAIRAQKNKRKFSEDLGYFLESEWSLSRTVDVEFQEPALKDDMLRMMFWCCHQEIKLENQILVILKMLCGFSVSAISRALHLPEETVKKRLARSKKKLQHYAFIMPANEQLKHSLDTVHAVLYLFFNEGYYCSDKTKVIDIDYCREAIALVNLLVDVPDIANRETLALYALMHFHMARIETRVDSSGALISLDMQDRRLWKRDLIQSGKTILSLAGTQIGNNIGRFYCEAHIALLHCETPTFNETPWQKIVDYYQLLGEMTESPVVKLNQAIALAYTGEIENAVKQVESIATDKRLIKSHLPYAILAHIYAIKQDEARARQYENLALTSGGTEAEQRLMQQQINRLLQA